MSPPHLHGIRSKEENICQIGALLTRICYFLKIISTISPERVKNPCGTNELIIVDYFPLPCTYLYVPMGCCHFQILAIISSFAIQR